MTSHGAAQQYSPLFEWASRRRVGNTLANLMIASGVKNDSPANMCLQFVAKESVRVVLDDWKDDDEHAGQLAALSDALVDSPEILDAYPAHTAAMPLKQQLHGQTKEYQILMCLGSRPLGGKDRVLRFWFDQLRVWMVLQGYRRAIAHHTSDKLVAHVAYRLRRAADDSDAESIAWIGKLRCSPPNVEALSRHLRWVTTQSATSQTTHRRFLSALERLALGEDAPLKEVEGDSLHALVSELQQHTNPASPAALMPTTNAPSRQEPTVGAIPADITPVDLEENSSHTTGLLSGRGIQLRKVEELQYLPWSWDAPTSAELVRLGSLIAEWEHGKEEHLQLLALLCRVAILTSRSLELAVSMRISEQPVGDWTVTRDLRTLHRLPPRRSDGWQDDGRHQKWIQPLSTALQIDAASWTAKWAAATSEASSLEDVWQRISPGEPAGRLFDRLCKMTGPLNRLSSDQLSKILGKKVYEASSDGVLAQVLSSRPTTGLGGNAAYPSWSLQEVKDTLNPLLLPEQVIGPANSNVAGSRLDPLDRSLRRSIRRATARVERLATNPDQWLEHHNALVTYVVGALLCGTGARPVTDPFESPVLFDWLARRVFVSDKASHGDSGRLVPLPKSLLGLVEAYCVHLRSLSRLLRDSVPAFAHEVDLLAAQKASSELPFFFFLRTRPSLQWYSVSSAMLTKQRLFIGPLPWNLGRHRLSRRLRSARVDPEVIDSLLGHADQGVLTHGDESPRTWLVDMDAALPALESVYQTLEFATFLAPSARTAPIVVDAGDELFHCRPFGKAARELRREQVRKEQTRLAVQLFKEALAGRAPAEVTPEQWDALSLKLLTVDGKRPHPHAAERYRTLQKVLTGLSRKYRLKLRRIFTLDKPVETPFRPCAIGSEQLLQELQQWFENEPSHPFPSQLGPRTLVALAALDLLLVSRVTSRRLLDDLLRNKRNGDRNFRIVVHEDQAFLEYHPLLHESPRAPVVRYRISWRCAEWLSACDAAYERDGGKLAVPPRWAKTCPLNGRKSAPTTMRGLVKAIAEIVEQANFIQRPGIIAAYSAGRLQTSALPHPHWVLHSRGTISDAAGETTADGTQASLVPARVLLPSAIGVWQFAEPESRYDPEAASLLFKKMRTALSKYRGDNDVSEGEEHITRRNDLATKLASYLAETKGVSSAVWCLAAWLISLVNFKERKTQYAISTVLRYFTALSHRFLEVGTDFDLVRADADDVVDYYDEVLEVNRDLDLCYVGSRLQAFHAFVCRAYGVQEIDWGELDCGSVVPHGSPGWIGEQQYLNALELLVPEVKAAANERLAAAFLLILSYRAGLRGADAIGLEARDWIVARDKGRPDITVCVRSNWLRRLKRPASRRIVPQLEPLRDLETSIVDEFTALFASLRVKNPHFPLFAMNGTGERFARRTLVDRVNDVLKVVHGYKVTMHLGRHSFGSRVAGLLMADHLRPPATGQTAPQSSPEVRRILLGSDGPTRRAPWALARALGHSRPSVAFKSYVHWIPMWCDEWNASRVQQIDAQRSRSELPGATVLDGEYRVKWAPRKTDAAAPPLTTPLAVAATYLDHVRHGARTDSAARAAGISPHCAARIDRAISRATDILKTRARQHRDQPLASILHHIDGIEWISIHGVCTRSTAQAQFLKNAVPRTLDCGLQMLGPNRQLVAWEEAHYHWLAEFVRVFELSRDAVALRTPSGTGERTIHIHAAGLTPFTEHQPSGKIDSVAGPQLGRLDRCALVIRAPTHRTSRTGGSLTPRTGTGLALMWAIYLGTFCD